MSNLLSIHNSKNQLGIGTNSINVSSSLTIKEDSKRYIVFNTGNDSIDTHRSIEFEDETTLSTVKTNSISSAKLLYISSNNEISSLALSSSNYLKISNTGGLVLIDKTSPIIQSISATDGTYGFTSPNNIINITVNFNETVIVTGTPSLTLSNSATASYISGNNSTSILFRYTIQQNDTDSSSLSVSSLSGTIEDLSDNPCTSISGTLGSVVVDTTIATVVSFIISNTSLKIGETATVTLQFSESVSGFNSDNDITEQNGSLATMTSSDNITWTGVFTPTDDIEDTTNILQLATSYTDTAGNSGPTAQTANYSIDTKEPTVVSFTISDTSLKVGETATVTLQFSESVSGFNSNDDISVQNGSLATMTSSDNITWIGTFTPTVDIEDTTNIIQLATSYTDSAGNSGPTAQTANYSIDTKAPTISIGAFSWGTKLEYGEDSSAGTVTVTTNNAENGQVITLGLNSNNYTATITGNSDPATNHSTIVTISAVGLQGLSTGNYTLTANVSDSAGNAATQTTATVEVDKTFSLSSWLDTSKQYKIFAVGSSAMTGIAEGGKKLTSTGMTSSGDAKINAGELDSSTRSSHLNSNTATNKSGAGYGIHWVGEGPYWLATDASGYPYMIADDHHITGEGFYAGQYDQSHITHHSSSTTQTYFYSTQTVQDDGTNEHNSVFNLVKGSQSDAYRFECKSITRNSSKHIIKAVSGYGGVLQTGSGHPYGDFLKVELSPQWKGGSPSGPSTLKVDTGHKNGALFTSPSPAPEIHYECVCVTLKGDYDGNYYGENLSDDSDMKNIFWVEAVSWYSSRRYMFLNVDTAGHSSYGGGRYYQWINRYHGGGPNNTTHGNSSTIAPTEFWICKIP
jgi:hypothetical protein